MVRLFTPDNPVIQILGRVCDMILLSILFTLSCALIIPAGAAVMALYIMTMKMVRDEESGTVKGYFAALLFLIVYALYEAKQQSTTSIGTAAPNGCG